MGAGVAAGGRAAAAGSDAEIVAEVGPSSAKAGSSKPKSRSKSRSSSESRLRWPIKEKPVRRNWVNGTVRSHV